jgi:hypothetical protein
MSTHGQADLFLLSMIIVFRGLRFACPDVLQPCNGDAVQGTASNDISIIFLGCHIPSYCLSRESTLIGP